MGRTETVSLRPLVFIQSPSQAAGLQPNTKKSPQQLTVKGELPVPGTGLEPTRT